MCKVKKNIFLDFKALRLTCLKQVFLSANDICYPVYGFANNNDKATTSP